MSRRGQSTTFQERHPEGTRIAERAAAGQTDAESAATLGCSIWTIRTWPRIAAFLKQEGLTRSYQRHTQLPQAPPTSLDRPHAEWQLDAQGMAAVAGVGKVCPAYGLPSCISLDHGTVFYDNTTPAPFPTRLHLWLLALGVDVRFTRKRCPTDHAIVERTHQTMTGQALTGQTWAGQAELWAGLDERREALNTRLPRGRKATLVETRTRSDRTRAEQAHPPAPDALHAGWFAVPSRG